MMIELPRLSDSNHDAAGSEIEPTAAEPHWVPPTTTTSYILRRRPAAGTYFAVALTHGLPFYVCLPDGFTWQPKNKLLIKRRSLLDHAGAGKQEPQWSQG